MSERPLYPNRYLIDFDDTICQTTYEDGRWLMGELVPGMKEAINQCAKDNEIIIFTSRPSKEWPQVTRYLAEHGIVFDGIHAKPLAKRYVDDRSMKPDEFIKGGG